MAKTIGNCGILPEKLTPTKKELKINLEIQIKLISIWNDHHFIIALTNPFLRDTQEENLSMTSA